LIKPVIAVMLGFSLAMDALAVSMAMVLCARVAVRVSSVTRVAGAFGLFQALMPMAGWVLAERSMSVIGEIDHWVAFALLAFVGGKMVFDGLRNGEECPFRNDPSRGVPLLMLSLGTSIDAMAVGVSFDPLGLAPFFTSAVIGIVTLGIVSAGMILANRIGKSFGERMTVAGGLMLIAIGVRILVTHLGS
jgi:manganese efflux pump family protein